MNPAALGTSNLRVVLSNGAISFTSSQHISYITGKNTKNEQVRTTPRELRAFEFCVPLVPYSARPALPGRLFHLSVVRRLVVRVRITGGQSRYSDQATSDSDLPGSRCLAGGGFAPAAVRVGGTDLWLEFFFVPPPTPKIIDMGELRILC